MKEKLNKIKVVIGTIVLSIIASALWETIFSPLLKKMISFFTLLPAKMFSLFGNWYASSVANANREYLSIELRLLLCLFFFFLILGIDYKKILHSCSHSFRFIWVIIIFIDLFVDLQISNASHFMLQNIEIVAPYIEEEDYLLLKSDYYSMETMDDMENINDRLSRIASEHSLHLH